jgi:hypothetical protein
MFKIRWGLHGKGLIEDHHVIPREFKNHPVIRREKYDLNASNNLIMLPTRLGKYTLRVRTDRLIHSGKHTAYNSYVEKMLNSIHSTDEFNSFILFLRQSLRWNPHHIPWS